MAIDLSKPRRVLAVGRKPEAKLPPEFKVEIDENLCTKCGDCVIECGWDVFDFTFDDGPIPDHHKCTACQRCVIYCPPQAITIRANETTYKENAHWTAFYRDNVWKQAATGGVLLGAMGADKPLPVIFDHLLLDACQVTNPSIDPLREPMELRTFVGRHPDSVEVEKREDGHWRLKSRTEKPLVMEIPVMFAAMSFGALSLNVHKSLAMAAREHGTYMNTGEGGLHPDLYPLQDAIVVQVASGRMGIDPNYLNKGVAAEIKIGQGAKPGIGGHLPGEKVDENVSKTRGIPVGADAISPAPHHDIYSIEDLRQLIYAIKEATGYKPVGVKIAAVHNVAAIASGIVRAGADWVFIDGYRGGTGAAPTMIRDHIGIPIEIAIAAVDDRLRQEGIRHLASIIAGGTIRSSADAVKAIALGADAVGVGTAALLAVGCTICQKCYTGKCSWGITTQIPYLVDRIPPDWGAERISNLLRGWTREIKEFMGALGINSIESLRGNRDRLRAVGLDEETTKILGVKPAGR